MKGGAGAGEGRCYGYFVLGDEDGEMGEWRQRESLEERRWRAVESIAEGNGEGAWR